MRNISTLNAIAVAAVSVVSLCGSAWAGNNAQPDWKKLEDRGRTNIKSFSGYTLKGADQTYDVTDRVLDDDGAQHIRFNRTFRGMRVLGGDLVVHNESSGNFRSASLSLNRAINVARTANISAGTAIKVAFDAYGGTTNGVKPELLVYARGDIPALAYDVRIFSKQSDGTPMELHVIVDASTSAVLDMWDDIKVMSALMTSTSSSTRTINRTSTTTSTSTSSSSSTSTSSSTSAITTTATTATGTGKSLFSGSVALTTEKVSATSYNLRDSTRGGLYTVDMNNATTGTGTLVNDADNIWGTSAVGTTAAAIQSAAVDAQYGAAKTWDYFKNVHARNGIGNDGVGTYNQVHYGTYYINAFWSDACFCMTSGDGDGTVIAPLVSIDITAHEMTHGITTRTANLTYSGESGALNEATSDIFGTAVEY